MSQQQPSGGAPVPLVPPPPTGAGGGAALPSAAVPGPPLPPGVTAAAEERRLLSRDTLRALVQHVLKEQARARVIRWAAALQLGATPFRPVADAPRRLLLDAS